ncbi:protein ecdysoneless homolog isoform X1 [Octopus sinensis]|uniref:Protein ecdysoneless homolog isoform X1 n=1 Tax=Octopus sinensis TaxID=2607531 RepID=A0A6P7T9D6_9MOLL|nr:protein ecdysoneless homolog isoform X1 [Octopus sinensis]
MAERRYVPEDVVEYSLFPFVSDHLDDLKAQEYLEEQKDIFLAHLSPLLVDYIWQKEPFKLKAVVGDESTPHHLHGCTHFGDNIQDEWFVVYLLCQLTQHFSGLVAKVSDNDEEFLLIEAADVLPEWLNPTTSENRILIKDGELHIIPMPTSSKDLDWLPLFTPTLQEAIQAIHQHSSETLASAEIRKVIKQRLECYPEKITQDFHSAYCYIPAGLAVALTQRPSLIAAGVNAFYYRDPDDLKACRSFRYFRPGTRVMTLVKFTRCLYAQLVQQNFQPHRESGWILPSSSNPKHKAHELGMKLAHGFEILCSKCTNPNLQNGESNDNRNIPDVRLQRFISTLTDKGYFKGELEGSVLYNEHLAKAKQYFKDNLDHTPCNTEQLGCTVLDLIHQIPYSIEELRLQERLLPPEDDDSWLYVSPQEVDAMILKAGGKDPSRCEKSFDPNQVSNSMKSFVDTVSDYEGAEFPKECLEDDINFDSTGFIHAMNKVFEFDEISSDSSSEMDEYDWNSSDEDTSRTSSNSRSEMKSYLKEMDLELSKTTLGKSFECSNKKSKPPRPPPPQKISESLPKKSAPSRPPPPPPPPKVQPVPPAESVPHNGSKQSPDDIDDEDEGFRPVNIDVNIVKNLLASHNVQPGQPGPATNILSSMGVDLHQGKKKEMFMNRAGSK